MHVHCSVLSFWLDGQAGGREGARAGKWGAAGGGQDGWVGGLTRGRAGERLLLAHVCPSSFMVQRVLDGTFPGGQAGGHAGAWLGQGVRGGEHVRGAVGRAGGLVGGPGGRGRAGVKVSAKVIALCCSLSLSRSPPILAPVPCAQPRDRPPLCIVRLLLHRCDTCFICLSFGSRMCLPSF